MTTIEATVQSAVNALTALLGTNGDGTDLRDVIWVRLLCDDGTLVHLTTRKCLPGLAFRTSGALAPA